MSIKDSLKRMASESNRLLHFFLSCYNFLPFNNKFRLRGNVLKINTSYLKRCTIDVKGKNNTIIINNGCRLSECRFIIRGDDNYIELSEFVSGKKAEFYIEDNDNRIICKRHAYFAGQIHLACTEGKTIYVGENCLFSSEVVLRTGDSHSVINEEGTRVNLAKDIVIGNHVWIGHRVLINKGVKISDDSVVGTGSVVTNQFNQKGVCIAGNPARVIKENITWLSER